LLRQNANAIRTSGLNALSWVAAAARDRAVERAQLREAPLMMRPPTVLQRRRGSEVEREILTASGDSPFPEASSAGQAAWRLTLQLSDNQLPMLLEYTKVSFEDIEQRLRRP
jgi:hypothetical protein